MSSSGMSAFAIIDFSSFNACLIRFGSSVYYIIAIVSASPALGRYTNYPERLWLDFFGPEAALDHT